MTKFLKLLGKLGAQPDWNQNDPTAADYVKNRTHYAVTGDVELFSGPISDPYVSSGWANYDVSEKGLIQLGKEYTVKLGNFEASGLVPHGDKTNVYLGGTDDFPFEIVSQDGGTFFGISYSWATANIPDGSILTIIGPGEIVKKLDNKFLDFMESEETEIIPETSIEFVDFRTGSFESAEPLKDITFVVGETYTVYWDGTEYRCEVKTIEGEGIPYIGNLSIGGAEGDPDTKEPFLCYVLETRECYVFGVDVSTHTLQVVNKKTVVKKDALPSIRGVAVGVANKSDYNFRLLDTTLGATSKELIAAVQGGGRAAVVAEYTNAYGLLWSIGIREYNGANVVVFIGDEFDPGDLSEDQLRNIETRVWLLPVNPESMGVGENAFYDMGSDVSTADFPRISNDNKFTGTNTFGANKLVLTDSTNKKWKLIVGTDGTLSTEAVS